MHGNAWELCHNLNEYSQAGQADVDVKTTDSRTLRGGSFYLQPEFVRSAPRSGTKPGRRDIHKGFRPARTMPR